MSAVTDQRHEEARTSQDGAAKKQQPKKSRSMRKSLDAIQAYAAADIAQQIRHAVAESQKKSGDDQCDGRKPVVHGPEDMTEGMAAARTVSMAGTSITYGAASFAGVHPTQATKVNQDAWVAVECFLSSPNKCLLGVFDGHGANGHEVSNFIVNAMPVALATALESAPSSSQAWAQAFTTCHSELKRHPTINANMSGSTAVVALLEGTRVLVGNLGDSRCIIGSVKEGDTYAQALSRDHTPELPDEKQRVLQMGGEVRPLMFRGQGFGPPRVWVRGSNRPGLCMTRSLGDIVAHMVGVSHLPELQSVPLVPDNKYLVICSDGISQFLSDADIIDLVHKFAEEGMLPHEVAKQLCMVAAEEWRKYDSSVDDCTAIIAFLDVEEKEPDDSEKRSQTERSVSGAQTSSVRPVSDTGAITNSDHPTLIHHAATDIPRRPQARRGSVPGIRTAPPVADSGPGPSLPPDMQGFSMRRLKDALTLKSGALGRMFRRRVSNPSGPVQEGRVSVKPTLPDFAE